MLSFFFNRFSKTVLLMEIAGFSLMAIDFALTARRGPSPSLVLILMVLLLYAFIRYCASRRWYKGVPRYSGIELQFKKAMVPTSYTMALTGLLFLAWPSAIWPGIALLFLAVVAHVNVILLYLRNKDTDPTPVNYFTSGKFLEHDAKHAHQK